MDADTLTKDVVERLPQCTEQGLFLSKRGRPGIDLYNKKEKPLHQGKSKIF
jgi:hypothetical protein